MKKMKLKPSDLCLLNTGFKQNHICCLIEFKPGHGHILNTTDDKGCAANDTWIAFNFTDQSYVQYIPDCFERIC